MADQDHHPLKGSKPPFFQKFEEHHSTEPEGHEKFRVRILLNPPPKPKMDKIPFKTPHEERKKIFEQTHGIGDEVVGFVKEVLESFGVEVVKVKPERGLMVIEGDQQSLEKLFKVDLKYYHHDVQTRDHVVEHRSLGHQNDIHIPEPLKKFIKSVIGLSEVPTSPDVVTEMSITDGNWISACTGLPADWFAKYYKFPEEFRGKGEHIAIISCGGGFTEEQLAHYFKKAGFDTIPEINWKSVDGTQNNPDSVWIYDYEIATDLMVAAGAAPEAKITVYFCRNSIQGFIDALEMIEEEFEEDPENAPNIVSYSWGSSESKYTQSELESLDHMISAVVQITDIAIFASAGDKGSTNDATNSAGTKTPLAVQYPASSPWVTSCGGTMFELNEKLEVTLEKVWNSVYLYYPIIGNATGGGFSSLFGQPEYQNGVITSSNYPEHATRRGVPDVSAYASISPDSVGYWVYFHNRNYVSGGTSAVAPLWAALLARFNQAVGFHIGFFNHFLYQMIEEGVFSEITEGHNSLAGVPDTWTAGPGWNPCCGLGVPNGQAMVKWLQNHEDIIKKYQEEEITV